MDWTNEQKNAIYKKDNNILVAAAAGSGKTAVLVERIIQKILKDGIDIDKLLVVTFTNAAASEMRERVLDAIYKKLDENPNDENLQKQIILLGKSNICTIHSFCLNVIKNNFFEIDLPANFRIASEEEISLLKQEVMEDIFEELYENENEKFAKLIESYTGYRGDEPVKEIIFDIYKVVQSMPFPKKWLEEKVEYFKCNEKNNSNFSNSLWGKYIVKNFKDEMYDAISNFKILKKSLDRFTEMQKYSIIIQSDIDLIQNFFDKIDNWDDAFELSQNYKFATWVKDKNAIEDLREEAKNKRDKIKEKVKELIAKTLLYNSEDAYNDIFLCYENLSFIKDLVIKFDEEFKKKKKQKNMIDFSDIEHYALEILVKEQDGKYIASDVAKKYQEKFEEVAVDEYQDSNQVQELILKTVSRGNNMFMVGDVKQSIYKFRQACPRLFMEKYENYDINGNESGLKIQLFKNFRSNSNILNIVNNVFKDIMSKELGEIDYTEEEYLNLGASYPQIDDGLGISECHIIDMNDEEIDEEVEEEKIEKDNELEDEEIELSKVEIEAIFVREKIQKMIKNKYKVKLKDGSYRNIAYKDIVILLRATASSAMIFEKELNKNGIPVFSDSNSEYLETMEVQTIINLLKIIDNPLDDIRLVSILRSPIGKFTDNEILEIRLENRESNVYSNLVNTSKNSDNQLAEKSRKFIDMIENWRKKSEVSNLSELIWQIYIDTGFLSYVDLMKNGKLRQANLKMLFERAKEFEKTSFSGLFNFIRFLEKLKDSSGDMSQAKIIGENENVVRIMSIHKSKGLEFPVVFLCRSNKKMNLQDLSNDILLHEEIGFGPQYINYDRKIEYPTAAKQAIKIVNKMETISEEMRILYVALTRAKEKLIVTGTTKDFKKDFETKKELLNIYSNENSEKINSILLKKYATYLDWIQLVYLKGELDNEMKFFVHQKNEFKNEQEQIEEKREFDFNQKFDENIVNFDWEYPDKDLINMPSKTSVSEIKASQNNDTKLGLELIDLSFIKENNNLTSSQKGTLIHLILQKLDFSKKYNTQEIQEFIENLVLKNVITIQEKENIKLKVIENFVNSEMYERILNAKLVEKEKTFCVSKKVQEFNMNEVLIQGIMDLYFIDEKENLVLVDYKTDYVDDGKVLIDRYKIQLDIYKEALENSLNKQVDEVWIYSTCLNEFVKIG